MKKIFLTGILTIIGFVGYSNANLTISRNGSDYNPNQVEINGSNLNTENYSCNSDANCCSMSIYTTNNTKVCEILYCNEEGDYFGCDNVLNGNYIIKYDNEYNFNAPFTSITLPDTTTVGSNTPGGDTPSGGNGGTTGGLISGGTEQFSGIIGKLRNILKEFAPYIIYIVIGCLGVSLLFNALKSLLGFTKGKAKNSIKGREERKGKKRRNRKGYTRGRRIRGRFKKRTK